MTRSKRSSQDWLPDRASHGLHWNADPRQRWSWNRLQLCGVQLPQWQVTCILRISVQLPGPQGEALQGRWRHPWKHLWQREHQGRPGGGYSWAHFKIKFGRSKTNLKPIWKNKDKNFASIGRQFTNFGNLRLKILKFRFLEANSLFPNLVWWCFQKRYQNCLKSAREQMCVA